MKIIHSIAVAATVLAFAGCDRTPSTPPEPQATEIPAATSTPAVEPAPVAAAPATTAEPAAMKMVGENRIEVTQAKVVGNVLNVELQLSNATGTGTIAEWVNAKDFYYIDDQSAKKVGLLTDDSGAPVANPLAPNGRDIEMHSAKTPKIVSLKFPAPAGDSISLNIPKLGSFDGLKVTR